MEPVNQTPIFTAMVMGVSGSGKSTLINSILGKDVAQAGISANNGVTNKINLYDSTPMQSA